MNIPYFLVALVFAAFLIIPIIILWVRSSKNEHGVLHHQYAAMMVSVAISFLIALYIWELSNQKEQERNAKIKSAVIYSLKTTCKDLAEGNRIKVNTDKRSDVEIIIGAFPWLTIELAYASGNFEAFDEKLNTVLGQLQLRNKLTDNIIPLIPSNEIPDDFVRWLQDNRKTLGQDVFNLLISFGETGLKKDCTI